MENAQNNEFSIKPAIEQSPFKNPVTQSFFTKWCEINNHITPQYLPRDEWIDRKKEGIITKNPDNTSTLLIPKDLKLWEMSNVIEEIDKDKSSPKPERKEQLNSLADMFQNVGVYIATRLEDIPQGRTIAEATAKDFYKYGSALKTGSYGYQPTIEEITKDTESPQKIAEIDHLFGVDKLDVYKHPEHDLKDIEAREPTRQEMLNQFFKATEKAAQGSVLHGKAIDEAVQEYLKKPFEKPQTELNEAIFRRGVKELITNFGKDGYKDIVVNNFKEIGIDMEGQKKSLREVLEIPRLKEELAAIRKTGEISKISDKEREIAFSIQRAVSKIPYQSEADHPSIILEHQVINCVGASMIGGALLDEVGIKYLVGGTPDHSLTLLFTLDKKIYVQDFLTDPSKNIELTKGPLCLKSLDGDEFKQLKKDDINLNDLGIFKNSIIMNYGGFVADRPFRPTNIGHQVEVANNFATELVVNQRLYKEAIKALDHSLALDPNNYITHLKRGEVLLHDFKDYKGAKESLKRSIEIYTDSSGNQEAYVALGQAYYFLGDKSKAIETFEKVPEYSKVRALLGLLYYEVGEKEKAESNIRSVIHSNEDYVFAYTALGQVYLGEEKYEKAVEVLNKAINLDLTNKASYYGLGYALKHLGRNDEAVKAFQKVIELVKDDKDGLVVKAKKQLQELMGENKS